MVNLKIYLQKLSADIFSQLSADEELSLFIHSEESQFIRFNGARVRQNTNVAQHEISVCYQKDQRSFKYRLNLTLDLPTDFKNILSELNISRQQLPLTDIYPQFVAMMNYGTSEQIKKVARPNDLEMLDILSTSFQGSDVAGLFCSGPVRQISINSKGQFHFFENDFFFLDYSIYNGPKAAKGFFSTENWRVDDLKKNIQQTKAKLEMLNKPTINIPRGHYRVYLEPMAMQEILWTMSWGGFSCGALHQGRSLLKKFHQNEMTLSPKFSMLENIGMGYVPNFNSLGEIAPNTLALVQDGRPAHLLVSTASAKEYNTTTNYAGPQEMFRSPEVKPGTLDSADILKRLDTGLYLSNLHYLNPSDLQSARITGMTRYACFWVEKGEIKGPIQDLRFDDSIYNLFGANLLELTTHQELFVESSTYQKRSLGAYKTPGALIENFNFTL